MGDWTTLASQADGFALPVFGVQARGARRGALVLAQEIFGVNANIQALAERFADDGFDVLAPAFFARIDPAFEADYGPEGIEKGRNAVMATPWDQVAGDAQTAIDALNGPVFAAGFCWGGTAAWVMASRCTGLSAAACFYGRMIVGLLDEQPKAPALLLYGRTDPHIPMSDVSRVRAAHPNLPIEIYEAGHGFFSDRSADFNQGEADRAWARTLRFFDQHNG